MRITIKDVAAAAGVQPAVVSAVLNGSRTIRYSEKTRDRILNLVREMGYRPNRAAQGLASRKSRQIGVLCFSPKDPFRAWIVGEIQKQLAERDYNAVFGFWNDEESARGAFETVLSHPIDGLICIHPTWHELIPPELPVVFGEQSIPGQCCVTPDAPRCIHDAVKYLAELGHRSIGYFSWVESGLMDVFQQTLPRFQMTTRPEWCPHRPGFYEKVLEMAREFFRNKELPSALLCSNDVAAFAVINAAREFGIRIPEDLSVIGTDDIDMASIFYPPLTTFSFPYQQYVTELLESLFAGAKPECKKIAMTLHIRATAAKRNMK